MLRSSAGVEPGPLTSTVRLLDRGRLWGRPGVGLTGLRSRFERVLQTDCGHSRGVVERRFERKPVVETYRVRVSSTNSLPCAAQPAGSNTLRNSRRVFGP